MRESLRDRVKWLEDGQDSIRNSGRQTEDRVRKLETIVEALLEKLKLDVSIEYPVRGHGKLTVVRKADAP